MKLREFVAYLHSVGISDDDDVNFRDQRRRVALVNSPESDPPWHMKVESVERADRLTAIRVTGSTSLARTGLAAIEIAIARELRELREAEGLSQDQLGRLAGCGAMLISHYERGRKTPTIVTLAKIVASCHMSLSDFFRLCEDDAADDRNAPVEIRRNSLLEQRR